jgi:hypothetical protein
MSEAGTPSSFNASLEATVTTITQNASLHSTAKLKWSHEPEFTRYVPTFDSPIGLYNISGVGDGVAILTLPTLAPTIYERSQKDSPTPTDLSSLKFVESYGEKGNLVLASRSFTRGEIVVTEPPILVGAAEQDLSFAEKEKYLKLVVGRLPEQGQKLITSLRSDKFQNEGHFLLGVLATNAGSFVVIEGMPHFVLYPRTLALINHDCGPKSVSSVRSLPPFELKSLTSLSVSNSESIPKPWQ